MKRFIILLGIALFAINLQSQYSELPKRLSRANSYFGIHFDLHAQEDYTDVGKTLTEAMLDTFLMQVNPDFVQIDCKGHPGISGYPTEIGYHVKSFEKDPLRLWRDVTAQRGIALYMHFSGVWDEKVVKEHPDWAIIKSNGETDKRKVSFFSPYLDTYLIPQLKELSSKYQVDGAWIDGECWAVEPDYGQASVNRFKNETGITEIPAKYGDPGYSEWMEYSRRLFREHLSKYINAIHEYNPEFQITSNWAYSSMMPEKVSIGVDFLSGDVTPQNGVYRSALEARCLAPQGKPWDLMAWGFSWNGGAMPMSIKSSIQLKQEAAQIISMGGGVQFYFQQNQDLSIKPWLEGPLSDIAAFCRERQKFCHKAKAIPQVALLYPGKAYQQSSSVPYSRSLSMLQGLLNALLDLQLPVEILMEHSLTGNMNQYPLIVIPECDFLDDWLLEELQLYVKQGGKLLIIGPETASLFQDELGIQKPEMLETAERFIVLKDRIGAIRSPSAKISLDGGAKALTYFYQGSDFRNPGNLISSSINNLEKGTIAAIYWNAGSSYEQYKTPVIRDFIKETIAALNPELKVAFSGSRLVHISLNSLNNRTYLNLVNVGGECTNQQAIAYDEIPPLQDLSVAISLDLKPSEVMLQPEGIKLKTKYHDGKLKVHIPELKIHSIIEIIP